jgi:hypothetical protein
MREKPMTPSSVYVRLPGEHRRIIDADVSTLFSVAAFKQNMSIEDIKRAGPWHPTVEYDGKTVFLSEAGVRALRRLQETLSKVPELNAACSKREIESQVAASHKQFICRMLQPSGEEFVAHAADALFAIVKDFQFLALVNGLELKDVSVVELGSVRVQRSERSVFEQIRFEGSLDLESVYERFKNAQWLVASVSGSPDLAAERFRHHSALTIGLFGIYGAVQYQGALWRTRVQAITPRDAPSTITTLRWEHHGENPVVSMRYGDEQPLPMTAESLAYVNEHCFFREFAALMDRKEPDELQSAILGAIYWFGDAYQDRNPTMKFVKLWSCMESFFSIERDGITDLNARGIAAVLTYGGYGVTDPTDYPGVKARLKKLYALRSQAVHRGKIGHVGWEDLATLSRWVAWVIISMMALSERGYQTLRRVHEEVSRADALHAPKANVLARAWRALLSRLRLFR